MVSRVLPGRVALEQECLVGVDGPREALGEFQDSSGIVPEIRHRPWVLEVMRVRVADEMMGDFEVGTVTW